MKRLVFILLILLTTTGHSLTEEVSILETEAERLSVPNTPSRDLTKSYALRKEVARRNKLLNKHDRFILVNLQEQRIRVIDDSRTVIDERVIIGKPGRETPTFTGTMTHLVLNPVWNVMEKYESDLMPSMIRARGLSGYYLVDEDGIAVPSNLIDWSNVEPSYRIVQSPGKRNMLGEVKFMFPNQHNVYIHDTPHKELFEEEIRHFSSGCIRMENPHQLTMLLMNWSAERLASEVSDPSNTNRTFNLKRPVKVHVVNWSTYVNSEGAIIYK